MQRHRQIELLLAKAAQDEYILDKLLPDVGAPVEVFGFHAQQAAEKLLKGVLVAIGTAYPRTHRIAELLDLIKDRGVNVPDDFEQLRFLTPFAVEFRYDMVPEDDYGEEPLDKAEVRLLITALRRWVDSLAAGGEGR